MSKIKVARPWFEPQPFALRSKNSTLDYRRFHLSDDVVSVNAIDEYTNAEFRVLLLYDGDPRSLMKSIK